MAPANRGLSIRAYAKHRRDQGLRGGTVSAVQRAISSGRIRRNKHGKIDPARADLAWEDSTDSTRGSGHATPGGSAPAQPARAMPIPNYQESRAIREAYAARTAKLEYDRMSESMVKAGDVQSEAFRLARGVRDAILGVPGRLASILAAETDPARIEAHMTEELRAALEMLSGADA